LSASETTTESMATDKKKKKKTKLNYGSATIFLVKKVIGMQM
jgi:hypothetical protein